MEVRDVSVAEDHTSGIVPHWLLDSLPEVVFVLDAEGRFAYVSAGVGPATGYQPRDLLGKHFLDVVAPEHHGLAHETYEALTEKGQKTALVELIVPHQDSGEKRHIEIHARAVSGDGQPLRVVGVARDITERHEYVSEVIMRQRLAGIVDLAVAAAHHINNPLSTVRAHVALLERAGHPSQEQLDSSLEQIEKAAERIAKVTQRLSQLADASLHDGITGIAMVDLGGWPTTDHEAQAKER